jgi:hypothetical protein
LLPYNDDNCEQKPFYHLYLFAFSIS